MQAMEHKTLSLKKPRQPKTHFYFLDIELKVRKIGLVHSRLATQRRFNIRSRLQDCLLLVFRPYKLVLVKPTWDLRAVEDCAQPYALYRDAKDAH